MYRFIELILNSAILWIYLHAGWIVLVSVLYHFCVPWIVWCSLTIAIGLRIVRIPPPDASVVREVLGTNPINLGKDNLSRDSQGNGEQYCMRVVAHRGGGYDYPENSLSAFRNVKSYAFNNCAAVLRTKSKEKGCSAVEFDVALTKDNIPIIFHDVTIERLTGQMGTIREMTWDQLKELDIAQNHPLREKFDRGEKIALLDDVLEECLRNGQRMFIDIKEKSLDIVQIILDAYNRHPELFKRAVVSSFNPIIVYMIRRKEPRIVCSLAWRPQYFSRQSYTGLEGPGSANFNNPLKHLAAIVLESIHYWALPRFTYYVLGLSAILLHKDIVTPEVVHQWHKRGVRVIIWTVNLPSEKLHFSRFLKVTYLTDTLLAEKAT